GDVLHHLHAQGGIEIAVVDGQGNGVALPEGDVAVRLAPAPSQGQHVRAGVHRHDRPAGPDVVEQFEGIEARPAADVENPLTGGGGQRLPHVAAPADHVPFVVRLLQRLGGGGVEGELRHRRRLYRPTRRAAEGAPYRLATVSKRAKAKSVSDEPTATTLPSGWSAMARSRSSRPPKSVAATPLWPNARSRRPRWS